MDTRYVGVAIFLLLYVAAALITPFLGFWYSQAFVFGSPLIATIAAVRMRESWPVVHPSLSFFYFFPAILILLWFATTWIQTGTPLTVLDWKPWLTSAALLTLGITAALVIALRKYIDREWAAVGTAFIVLIYSMWTLGVLNKTLPQRETLERASIVSLNPGLVRVRAWSITIEPAGPFDQNSEHVIAPGTFRAADVGLPICLFTYSGALGWRWTSVARCPS